MREIFLHLSCEFSLYIITILGKYGHGHFQDLIIQVLSSLVTLATVPRQRYKVARIIFTEIIKLFFIPLTQIVCFSLDHFLHIFQICARFQFPHNSTSYAPRPSLSISRLCSPMARGLMFVIFKKSIKKLIQTLLYLQSGFHF